MRLRVLLSFVGCLAILPGTCSNARLRLAAPRYAITEIGPLPGYSHSGATAINASGQIAGTAFNGGETGWGPDTARGFIYRNGQMTDLGSLGGKLTIVTGMNNAGEIVGFATTARAQRAFLWTNGKLQDLGDLGGGHSQAYRINNKGQIVGGSRTAHEKWHAILWHEGKTDDLGALGDKDDSFAHAINDVGQVVGESYDHSTYHAFLWRAGRMSALDTLGGESSNSGEAHCINDKGAIVGSSSRRVDKFLSKQFAVLWVDGKIRDLGTLPDYEESSASSINNRGQIVGRASRWVGGIQHQALVEHAVLWERGQIYDLNRLILRDSGWVLEQASCINDRGQIVGRGKHRGKERAFLLTPIQDEAK